jgi:hypothetical protein
MNPMLWKREHQVALACAFGVGTFVAFVIALIELDTYSHFRWGALWCSHGQYSCIYLLNGYWLRVSFCSLAGGFVGAAIVYIRQLLRV